MTTSILKLGARLLTVPLGAIFLIQLLTVTADSLNNVAYALTENTYGLYLRYDTREMLVFCVFVVLVVLQVTLEIASFSSSRIAASRILFHLRYGPIAVLFLSTVFVIMLDLALVEVSKYQVRSYVYQNSISLEPPDLTLHNDYRGRCGNGVSARENYLYFEAASSGAHDPDPYVRSRSILMSSRVQNWMNGGDPRFDEMIAEACSDTNEVVKQTVDNYLTDRSSSCDNLRYKRRF
jgi:hypothetical protein